MHHEVDPRQELLDKAGDLADLELCKDTRVLCAVYIAPARTAGGIWRPDNNVDEDKYQGKVGLILKKGPRAFQNDDKWTFAIKPEVGDWVYYRPSDTFALTINGALCRELDDVDVRGRISHPDQVW